MRKYFIIALLLSLFCINLYATNVTEEIPKGKEHSVHSLTAVKWDNGTVAIDISELVGLNDLVIFKTDTSYLEHLPDPDRMVIVVDGQDKELDKKKRKLIKKLTKFSKKYNFLILFRNIKVEGMKGK